MHEEPDDHNGCDGETSDFCLLQRLMSLLVIGTKDDELLGDLSLAAVHLHAVSAIVHDFFAYLLLTAAPIDIADSLSVGVHDAIYVASAVSMGFSSVVSHRGPPIA